MLGWEIAEDIEKFLNTNNHNRSSATWAANSYYGKEEQKKLVLDDIQSMLLDNIPVVFNYYSSDKKIKLYSSLEVAKSRADVNENQEVGSHYMTIIGLYKYLDKESTEYEYIMKVVSWGNVYYIRYDQYSDNLKYLSNIISVR